MATAPFAVTLQWGDVPLAGRTGYFVTVNGVQVADHPSSPYTFNQLSANTTYTLGIQAHDGSSGVSQVYTTTYTTPTLPSTVVIPTTPTWIGNSNSGPFNNVPDGIQVISAVPAGGCLTGASWNENVHDGVLYTSSGGVRGPLLCTRNGPGGGGVWGICTDGTYVFYADGIGHLIASRLSTWAGFNNVSNFDNGTSVLGLLSLSSNNLMDAVTSGGFVYVLDPGGAIGTSGQVAPTTTFVWKVGPFTGTSWGTATNLVTVPYARRMCFDRQGNLWVLTQGVSGNPTGSNLLVRYNTSGTLLQSNAVPASIGYAMDIACDPASDQLYLPDNGTDQQIKVLSYDNTNAVAPAVISTIGQQGGYLDTTQAVKGTLGPLRFAGLRGCALDSAGNMYVAQTGDALGGQSNWPSFGHGCIVSMLTAGFATEGWRVSAGFNLGGVGAPSADWNKAYSFYWRYQNTGGQFGGPSGNPDACTFDPTQDFIGRQHNAGGNSPVVYVRDDVNPGTRYVLANGPGAVGFLDIYQEVGAVLVPRVSLQQFRIITNGTTVTGPNLAPNDAWMDDSGNVWMAGRTGDHIYRFRLNRTTYASGFAPDGTPQYDYGHMDTYPLPPQINSTVHNIVVHGTNVYLAGFTTADDPNLAVNPGGASQPSDYYKMLGRVVAKWSSLPTGGGWSTPAWSQTITYPGGGAWSETGGPIMYPNSFDVDVVNGVIVVAWFHDSAHSNTGWFTFHRESDGTQVASLDPPFPQYAVGTQGIGSFDMIPRSVSCANGWVWCEDDWSIKSPGMSLAPYKGL